MVFENMSSYLNCFVRLQSNAGFVFMVKEFFKIQICDFVLRLFSLTTPGIFIQSSSDLRGLVLVLKLKPKFFLFWFWKCSETLKPDLEKKQQQQQHLSQAFRLQSFRLLEREKMILE